MMKVLLVFMSLGLLYNALAVEGPPQPFTDTTTQEATTPPITTTSETPAPTAPAPNTTTSSTSTSSTTTSTTTTSATTSSTTSSTTTTSVKTTTQAPVTTAVPPVTTSPAPKPGPPEMGKWSVKDESSNVTCIIADMAIQINVSYNKPGNKSGNAIINVPTNSSKVNGTCGNSTQLLEITWNPNSDVNFTDVLTMRFQKDSSQKKFMLSDITLTLEVDPEDFPDADKNVSQIVLQHNRTLFTTSLLKSYRCVKLQNVELIDEHNNTLGLLKVSHVQLEAFHETNTTEFGAVEDCESAASTDIVPIAVGCALVGLVAIVLVSYLVGRRRSQARGYLSM